MNKCLSLVGQRLCFSTYFCAHKTVAFETATVVNSKKTRAPHLYSSRNLVYCVQFLLLRILLVAGFVILFFLLQRLSVAVCTACTLRTISGTANIDTPVHPRFVVFGESDCHRQQPPSSSLLHVCCRRSYTQFLLGRSHELVTCFNAVACSVSTRECPER